MSSEEGVLDRKALYDRVWSEPISKLAERYGYSDVGFSKLCRRLEIPLPSRGHWARVQAGQTIRQPPLPPAPKNQFERVRISPLSDAERDELTSKRQREASIRKSISAEDVLAEAGHLHPLAKEAKKRLKQKDGWSDYKSLRSAPREVLDIEVTKDAVDRAVLLASVLLRELERLGTTIRIDAQKGRTVLELRDTTIGLKITEHVARTPHEATPAEKRALQRYQNSFGWRDGSVEYPHIPQYDFTPTGLLTITASGWPQRNWRDSSRTGLEKRIGEVAVGIIGLAEQVRDREVESARKAAEHAEKVEHYKAVMKRRTEERDAYRALRVSAKEWAAAQQLRAYLTAVEARASKAGILSDDLSTWLDWAARKADWLDPTIAVSDVILDAPAPEKPGYGYW